MERSVCYLYAHLTGDPRKQLSAVDVPVGVTAGRMLSKILEEDPYDHNDKPLTRSDFCMYESMEALTAEKTLKPTDRLNSGLGTESEPILLVPRIRKKVVVAFVTAEKTRKEGKETTTYKDLARASCTLICDQLDVQELKRHARDIQVEGDIRGFVLRDNSGRNQRLKEAACGLYNPIISEHHYLDGAQGVIEVIVADSQYYDEKVELSNAKISDWFPVIKGDGDLTMDVVDLLEVHKTSPPADVDDINKFISAAERVIYCIMTFKGLEKEQFSHSLASTVQYIALLVVMLDARKAAGEVLQTGVSAGAGEVEGGTGDSRNAPGYGGGQGRRQGYPELVTSQEEREGLGRNAGGGGSGSRRGGPVNNRVEGRRSAESADIVGVATTPSPGGDLHHYNTRSKSNSKEGQTSPARASAPEIASTVPSRSPLLGLLQSGASARHLVMAEEMPIAPRTIIDVGGKFVYLTGYVDYLVAHAGEGSSMDRLLSEGGVVVTEVKQIGEYGSPKGISQAVAGALAILTERKVQRYGQGGSGGPMHVMKTDGIRWQCGRVVERLDGTCPQVKLGEEVNLHIRGGWPTNLRMVVNYVAKVFRENLRTSPRVSDLSSVA